MKKAIGLAVLSGVLLMSFKAAYVFKTGTGTIKFFSSTNMENIDATSNQVAAGLASATGVVEFAVSINSFQFKKAQMQKHFQENYMESNSYPKSSFSGKIADNVKVNYDKDGVYPVKVTGTLNMHGVKKSITVPGKLKIMGKKAGLQADFTVKLSDYNIKVPANNAANVSQNIKISVDCTLSRP